MAGLFCFFGFEPHHSVFHDVSAQLGYGQKGFVLIWAHMPSTSQTHVVP